MFCQTLQTSFETTFHGFTSPGKRLFPSKQWEITRFSVVDTETAGLMSQRFCGGQCFWFPSGDINIHEKDSSAQISLSIVHRAITDSHKDSGNSLRELCELYKRYKPLGFINWLDNYFYLSLEVLYRLSLMSWCAYCPAASSLECFVLIYI